MPNNYWEKREWWESLLKIKEFGAQNNCIIAGYFNTTLHQGKKKGVTIVKDPFKEHMEDLISELNLFDVQPSKGKFTWSNKILGVGHITTRLDFFLVHSSILLHPLNILSQIVPWGIAYHRPIALSFDKVENMGPIPFKFNPIWLDSPDLLPLISSVWSIWVDTTLMYIWEQKLKK